MKTYFLVFIGLAFILNSCDNELHRITVKILIENKTHKNLHCIYDTKDFSLPDSIYKIASLNNDGFMQCNIDTFIYRDNVLSDTEFSALISKFKIYYVENKDTFHINNTFYDGKSYWNSDIYRQKDGIIFGKNYWWCEYKATLTADMFVKK